MSIDEQTAPYNRVEQSTLQYSLLITDDALISRILPSSHPLRPLHPQIHPRTHHPQPIPIPNPRLIGIPIPRPIPPLQPPRRPPPTRLPPLRPLTHPPPSFKRRPPAPVRPGRHPPGMRPPHAHAAVPPQEHALPAGHRHGHAAQIGGVEHCDIAQGTGGDGGRAGGACAVADAERVVAHGDERVVQTRVEGVEGAEDEARGEGGEGVDVCVVVALRGKC